MRHFAKEEIKMVNTHLKRVQAKLQSGRYANDTHNELPLYLAEELKIKIPRCHVSVKV